MKGKRRLSGVLLIIAALIIMQLPVSEADAATSASDFKMEGTTLVGYVGTDTTVSIPDTVEIIGQSAFDENDKIERVVIPGSVKVIEPYAFWGCDNLTTVVLGSGLEEVSDYAFTNCKGLTQMNIPKTIQRIGIQAFADCINMTDITIPPEVTVIHDTAFDGCYKLYIHCESGSVADEYAQELYKKQEEMPEYEDVSDNQEPIISESDSAVEEKDNEQTVSQPEIKGNLLGSTHIVGNSAVVFMNNTTPTVLSGNENSIKDISEEKPIDNVLQNSILGTLPKYTIVDGKIVADQAYYKNNSLTRVLLPTGIEEIGQFAFARSSIKEVVIPEGVKTISYGAFYHCDNLEKVYLPNTIENVEPKAFVNSLWVEDFIENGTEKILVSGNVLVAYRGPGTEVEIPEGVTVIAAEAFMNQTELRRVKLPESLLTIGEGAFEGCTNLSEIEMGAQLLQIKDRAFAGCPFEQITLPASVSEVGLKAFDETVEMVYQGSTPTTTHEISAERLSNEDYRPLSEEKEEPGVVVPDMEFADASLEGAKRSYTLTVIVAEDKTLMETAYQRTYENKMPESMTVYQLQLTDNSKIPLTKLGKNTLTVTLPIPRDIRDENVTIYTLDRNGQLETLASERVLLDGMDAVRFQTTYLSLFGICGDGSAYQAGDVIEVSTTIQSMSHAPGNENHNSGKIGYLSYLKWGFGMVLLLGGTAMIIRKGKRT